MRNNHLIKTCLIGLSLLASTQAMAEARFCSQKVGWTSLAPDGSMAVYLPGIGAATFCNVNGTINTTRGAVTSETCKGWYAGFTTALARGSIVTLGFHFGDAAAPACDAMGFSDGVPGNYPYYVGFNQ